MVKFIKYPSLTNHDAEKSLEFLRQAGLLSTRGHITEKFHGCFRGNSMVRM